MDQSHDSGPDPRPAGAVRATASDLEPPPLDDDEDVLDAEIVETSVIGSSAAGSMAPDYSDSGVPSLDYLRDRIEGRSAAAAGSAELAEAAASREAAVRAATERRTVIDAEHQRGARESAAKDRLDEIRRSLHPDG